MRRRFIIHGAVLVAFMACFVELPSPTVYAGSGGQVIEPRLIEWTPPENLPRAAASGRGPQPTPLPTPIPIDPDATPLPAPTNTPAPILTAPPTPLPDTSKSVLLWPVNGSLSQGFSAAHPAVDIAAAYGLSVIASAAGTVVVAGWVNNGGGYQVHIDTGWGIVGLHHLSGVSVTTGQWVSATTVIGAVGCTGICTGPHVHWNLLVDGYWRNPLEWL